MKAHKLSGGRVHLLGNMNVGKTFAQSSVWIVIKASRNVAFRTCSVYLTLPSANLFGFYFYLLSCWLVWEAQGDGLGLMHLLLQGTWNSNSSSGPGKILFALLTSSSDFSPPWRKTQRHDEQTPIFFVSSPQIVQVLRQDGSEVQCPELTQRKQILEPQRD